MNIFKNLANTVKKKVSDEGIKIFFDFTKNKIIEQAKTTLEGYDKKKNVDNAVILFIKSNFKSVNPVQNALINILIEYIPVLTQCIYENLKKYVDGLTEA